MAGDVVLGPGDLAGRVADGDRAGRDVAADDAAGADDRVVADRRVGQDDAAGADEHAAADDDPADAGPAQMALRARVVGQDLDARGERGLVADGDQPAVPGVDRRARADIDAAAELQPARDERVDVREPVQRRRNRAIGPRGGAYGFFSRLSMLPSSRRASTCRGGPPSSVHVGARTMRRDRAAAENRTRCPDVCCSRRSPPHACSRRPRPRPCAARPAPPGSPSRPPAPAAGRSPRPPGCGSRSARGGPARASSGSSASDQRLSVTRGARRVTVRTASGRTVVAARAPGRGWRTVEVTLDAPPAGSPCASTAGAGPRRRPASRPSAPCAWAAPGAASARRRSAGRRCAVRPRRRRRPGRRRARARRRRRPGRARHPVRPGRRGRPATAPAAACAACPFAPTSFWNAPLAADAPLDAKSATWVTELRRQLATTNPWINTTTYSTPVYTVPAGQPTVRVTLDTTRAPLQQAFEQVPIPDDAGPPPAATRTSSSGSRARDTMWEFWLAARRPTAGTRAGAGA